MAPPIFPALYGFNIKKKPTFATISRQIKSGRQIGAAQQPIPLWEFELRAEVLREETQNAIVDSYMAGDKQLQELSQLFLACAAQYGEFFFDDWSDNSRTLQTIAVADGSETEFFFLRTINNGSDVYIEPVGGINITETVRIYFDGVEIPSSGNWAINADQTKVVFASPPTVGTIISATFHFYYLCRFISDEMEFEEFLYNRWAAPAIHFRSTVPYTLVTPGSLLYEVPWIPLGPVPEPPISGPPVIDGANYGRNNLTDSGTQIVSMTLTTVLPRDLIVVYVFNEENNNSVGQTVASLVSTSGLNFTRRAGGIVNITDFGNTALNLEVWTAPSLNALNNEVITATLTAAAGNVIIAAHGVNNLDIGNPMDPSVDPGLYASSDTGGVGPSVTISTANANDILLWAAGGMTLVANSGAPTDFTPVSGPPGTGLAGITAASHHDGRILYFSVFYDQVTSLQSSRVVTPSVQSTRGSAVFLALQNPT